jgi:hypothetical protein
MGECLPSFLLLVMIIKNPYKLDALFGVNYCKWSRPGPWGPMLCHRACWKNAGVCCFECDEFCICLKKGQARMCVDLFQTVLKKAKKGTPFYGTSL